MALEEVNFLRKNSCNYGISAQNFSNWKKLQIISDESAQDTVNLEPSRFLIYLTKTFLTVGSLRLPWIFCENIWHFCPFFPRKNFLRKIKLFSLAWVCFNYFPRHRLPKNQWWLHLQQLLRIMAKHQHIYDREAEDEVWWPGYEVCVTYRKWKHWCMMTHEYDLQWWMFHRSQTKTG